MLSLGRTPGQYIVIDGNIVIQVVSSYPRRLVFEMTSACNIHCRMCGRSAVGFKPTFFQKEWLEFLALAADKAEEVTLLGGSTLPPEFEDFLAWGMNMGSESFSVLMGQGWAG